ncbi:MAG: hypothetical protein U5K71_08735 [Gracilimonas sp.]|nr:hypothetical protein [Gracilimonas sp.]
MIKIGSHSLFFAHAFRIVRFLVVICVILISSSTLLKAQEINFGDFSSKYTVSITELIPADDLAFGMVIQNEGLKTIDLLDAKVLMIEGVKYLDVIVDITADNYLFLDNDVSCNGTNSNCIPFTLQAAYANRGNNNTNQAILMQVASNVASAQFPILARGNRPPGPPPTPDFQGYNPALFNETAYLYLYGSINVGNVNAGSYSGQITVTVTYD